MKNAFSRENLQRAAFFVFMAMVPFAAARAWTGMASACGMSGCGCGSACACGDTCNCGDNVDR